MNTQEIDLSQFTPEQQEKINQINELVNSDKIDPTTALNIIVNAVTVCYDSETFNELDKMLISKALSCFKSNVDLGEDFLIKVK